VRFVLFDIDGTMILMRGKAVGARVIRVASARYRLEDLREHEPELLVTSCTRSTHCYASSPRRCRGTPSPRTVGSLV
jgi:hypothetical protein